MAKNKQFKPDWEPVSDKKDMGLVAGHAHTDIGMKLDTEHTEFKERFKRDTKV
jgi:hypothetical protein